MILDASHQWSSWLGGSLGSPWNRCCCGAAELAPASPQPEPTAAPTGAQSRRNLVACLPYGRLNPAGNVRRLDAPSGAMGSSPRVETLLVEEGDRVEAGQAWLNPTPAPTFEATLEPLLQREALRLCGNA